MKSTFVYGVSAVAVLMSLGGCGGGSSSINASIGTAYYIDSAVSGIRYVCGSQSGTTSGNGAFTFEEGKGCTFYLDEMTLRTIEADQLYNDARIVESDANIARMLQTLDNDGDASNGITITREVIAAMAEHNITSLPDSEADFEALNQALAAEASYQGSAVSEADAEAHLEESRTTELQNMLAGNVFYVPSLINGTPGLTKATINVDATNAHAYRMVGPDMGSIQETGMNISGYLVEMTEAGFTMEYVGSTKQYLQMDEYHIDETYHSRWYHVQADAEAYMEQLGEQPADLEALIVGKTFYQHCTNTTNGDWISENAFETNGTITINELGKTRQMTYRIESEKFYVTRDNEPEQEYIVIASTSAYFTIRSSESGEEATFYASRTDAQAASPKQCDEDNGEVTSDLATLIVGKTLYMTQCDAEVQLVTTASFGEDGTLAVNSNEGNTTYTYEINGDELLIKNLDGTIKGHNALVEANAQYVKLQTVENSSEILMLYFDSANIPNECSSNVTPSELETQLVSGHIWGEYKDGAAYPQSCYIFDGTQLTGYFDGNYETPYTLTYEVNGTQMRYIHVGQYVASTDTFTYRSETELRVHKVWSDDFDDRTWRVTSNCPDVMLNDEGPYTMRYGLVAGKTFYVYGYSDAGTVDGGHVILTFGSDGTTVSAQAFDGTPYGSGNVTINDNALVLTAAGETKIMKALRTVDGMMYTMDISDTGGYPEVLATEEQSDDGEALLQQLEASYLDDGSFNQENVVGTYYSVILDNSDERGGCGAEWTLGSDGTLVARYRDDQGTPGTAEGSYSVSGNMLIGEMEGQSYPPMRMISNDFDGLTVAGEKYFNNRDDAVAFAALLGNENCDSFYPAR